jgi:hypothetical protein
MQIFQVQPWPKGVGNSEVSDYVKVESVDELDAAEGVLQTPLQSGARRDMYIPALRRPTARRSNKNLRSGDWTNDLGEATLCVCRPSSVLRKA